MGNDGLILHEIDKLIAQKKRQVFKKSLKSYINL